MNTPNEYIGSLIKSGQWIGIITQRMVRYFNAESESNNCVFEVWWFYSSEPTTYHLPRGNGRRNYSMEDVRRWTTEFLVYKQANGM